jgi:hypothetical protein
MRGNEAQASTARQARGIGGFVAIRRMLPALFMLAGVSLTGFAQPPAFIDREPEIKAAYLYNFGRYVEWPAVQDPKVFIIGVVGDTPVTASLETIARNKMLNNKKITVQKIKVAADFKACDMLFVPAGQDAKVVDAVLAKAKQTSALIVGETPAFAANHGHIGFVTNQNVVKFDINTTSAQKTKLKISAKLLNLGRIVGN